MFITEALTMVIFYAEAALNLDQKCASAGPRRIFWGRVGTLPPFFFLFFLFSFVFLFSLFFFFSLLFLLFPFKNHKKFTQTTITSSKTNFIRKKRHPPPPYLFFLFSFVLFFLFFPFFFTFSFQKSQKIHPNDDYQCKNKLYS